MVCVCSDALREVGETNSWRLVPKCGANSSVATCSMTRRQLGALGRFLELVDLVEKGPRISSLGVGEGERRPARLRDVN